MRPLFDEFKVSLDQVERVWLRRSALVIITPFAFVIVLIISIIDSVIDVIKIAVEQSKQVW